jgi:hypothetical protein
VLIKHSEATLSSSHDYAIEIVGLTNPDAAYVDGAITVEGIGNGAVSMRSVISGSVVLLAGQLSAQVQSDSKL